MFIDVMLLIAGGFGVWLGAEGMVKGAVYLAKYLGISALVIGSTIVALGTSAPELVVSAVAAFRGHTQIALGNVVGSNIFNIAVVLGLSALITPVKVAEEVIKRDMPLMIGATLLMLLLVFLGNEISRLDALLLLVLFGAHSYLSFRLARRDQAISSTSLYGIEKIKFNWLYIVFLLGGTVVLAGGAELMVRGAVGIAESLGISKQIIGLTIVAFGTSIPELAASVVAAKHGESDLAIGNVVGSNVYNILLILGVSGLILPIPGVLNSASVDFLFCIGLALLIVPISLYQRRIGRLRGLFLFSTYLAFVAVLLILK